MVYLYLYQTVILRSFSNTQAHGILPQAGEDLENEQGQEDP